MRTERKPACDRLELTALWWDAPVWFSCTSTVATMPQRSFQCTSKNIWSLSYEFPELCHITLFEAMMTFTKLELMSSVNWLSCGLKTLQTTPLSYLCIWIYILIDWCFKPCPKIFQLYGGGQNYSKRNPGKFRTINWLLANLPTYCWRGRQPELDFNWY